MGDCAGVLVRQYEAADEFDIENGGSRQAREQHTSPLRDQPLAEQPAGERSHRRDFHQYDGDDGRSSQAVVITVGDSVDEQVCCNTSCESGEDPVTLCPHNASAGYSSCQPCRKMCRSNHSTAVSLHGLVTWRG